jgi:hypothetical protein
MVANANTWYIMNIDWKDRIFIRWKIFLIWQIFVSQLYIIIIFLKYYKNIYCKLPKIQ